MLSDYERELSTHYAQVRKRLRGEVLKKPMPIPPRPEPVLEVLENPKPDPVVVEPKRDFVLIVNQLPWRNHEKEEEGVRVELFRRSYKNVLDDVSRETGIPAKLIIGRQRCKHMVEARRYFWWRVVEECPHLSIADIGRRSGHDHTTVLHAVARFEEILAGEFNDHRVKGAPKSPREREKSGRYVRHRATGRKWTPLAGLNKTVD